MRAVNLLPVDEQQARLQGVRLPLLAVVGSLAAVTVGAIMLSISASALVEQERAELAEVDAAIAALPQAPTPAVSQVVLAQERTDRTAALSAALATRIPLDRVLREISLVLPRDAWLTGITAIAPAPGSAGSAATSPASAGSTSDGVTIQGVTYSHEAVARVIARLAVVPSFSSVRLTASALVELQAASVATGPTGATAPTQKTRPVVTFTVVASLRTGGVS
ncbi:MAG TPA: PilN domain-containing protein [Gaiellaceae bacterium]|nr:PilN domain-containing protein [Gaiellaceae bacterium]